MQRLRRAYAILCRRLANLAPRFVIDRYSIALAPRALPALGLSGNQDFVKPFPTLTAFDILHQVINILVKRRAVAKLGGVQQRGGKTVSHAVGVGPAAPGAGKCAGQNIGCQAQSESLVPGERKQRTLWWNDKIRRIGAGAPLRIKQAAGRNGLAAVMRNRDLAAGDGAGGNIDQNPEGWRCGEWRWKWDWREGAARDLPTAPPTFRLRGCSQT